MQTQGTKDDVDDQAFFTRTQQFSNRPLSKKEQRD
jgi:hypothetical protein